MLFSFAAVGCGPDIGDECETALDCSSQGSRLCDRTQPNGYCTIRGCEEGTCPEDSICVKFRPGQSRLALTYCMYGCEEDDDCRNDEGYRCARASDIGDAEILGDENARFCAARPRAEIEDMMSVQPPIDSSTGSLDAAMSSEDDGGS